ncbi:MAG: DUF3105 domain-containing protein [Oscillochloris sp.]|nr:DUF3105 domain-containing protein [Oscillochloris sp.]
MAKRNTRRRSSAARRRSGGSNWLWIGLGVLAVALIGWALVGAILRGQPIEGEQAYGPFVANQHVTTPVNYTENPPVGGPHYAAWQNCGIYNREIANENAVHSLEHGAVWVAYSPDLAAGEVEQLKNLVRGRSYTLMSQVPNMDTPIALSAWGAQLKVDSAADPRIEQFIAKYRQGSQTPEPGASCVGGVGAPDER